MNDITTKISIQKIHKLMTWYFDTPFWQWKRRRRIKGLIGNNIRAIDSLKFSGWSGNDFYCEINEWYYMGMHDKTILKSIESFLICKGTGLEVSI